MMIHSTLLIWSLSYDLSGQPLGRLVVAVVVVDDDAAEVAVWSPYCSCWMLKHLDSEQL